MSMADPTDPQTPPRERRRRPELREVFDHAYAMIEPFFDPASGWGGRSLEHLAFRVLRENFPALSAEDVHVVIAAAHRVFIEANPGRSEHLRRPEDLRPKA